MLYKDFEGCTEEEALKKALEELQRSVDQVRVEVLSSIKTGFLGIGRKKVEIRVFYKETEEIYGGDGGKLESVLSHIMNIVGMIDGASTSTVKKLEGDRYLIHVDSPDPARLIGKHGRIIEALQDVINGILQRNSNRFKVVIDVVGYNQTQKVRILTRAKKIALEILKRGGKHTLDPMNPFYRRMVHLELQKIDGIMTTSKGEENLRSIIIFRKPGTSDTSSKNRNSIS